MPLVLNPFLCVSVFRREHIEPVLREIRSYGNGWFPTADEIADHYLLYHYNAAVAAIDGLRG